MPADLERVILSCLAKSPEDRFQDVFSLEQALAECAAADRWSQWDAVSWWRENDQTTSGPQDIPVAATAYYDDGHMTTKDLQCDGAPCL